MSASPPFHLILLAQSLGAASELFGQRLSRQAHNSSNIRMLISMSVYCCIQAFVVLGILQLVLPESMTGGQGSFSLFTLLSAHPSLLINAANNSIYWLALVYTIREPLGPVLVVLAFLVAALTVGLFQTAVGLQDAVSLPGGSIALGIIGTILCVADVPITTWQRICGRNVCWNGVAHGGSENGDNGGSAGEDAALLEIPEKVINATISSHFTAVQPSNTHIHHANGAANANMVRTLAFMDVNAWKRTVAVAVAFVTLAFTTGVGITVATYFETHANLNSFGYTAVDQILLPVTTLPLAWLLDSFQVTRRFVGEPDWSETRTTPPNFLHTLRRTLKELNTTPTYALGSLKAPSGGLLRRLMRACAQPWPFWFTLIPFHGFEFLRTLLFFYLVTQFDVETTYLQMTLIRIVLCWLASLVACRFLAHWVGLKRQEVLSTLHPANLSLRVFGSVFLIFSILILKDII